MSKFIMVSKNTQLRAKDKAGSEVHLSHSQTDSPILDVNSLQKLHEFRPDIVDFVINQTQAESEFRRAETARINNRIFIERILGILLAGFVCVSGIVGGVWAASKGHEKLGIAIVVSCIGTLAVAFITRKKQ
ncbi:hypothetical protein QEO94_03080 [Kingella negevensis]|uniref:hypothetical protein n=1 Tax=Kingella negevensis TaxID=1522312 RepID=UPI002542FF74|nr:hypothetical protein [Kingella negevensis]WII93812.1 hypothetical protein QEO94_03080 [Kingella negevensis]